jgi:hypothetical protein
MTTFIREHLLTELRAFVESIRFLPEVRRIALIGSLTTEKQKPKDADVLVTVEDETDLNGWPRPGGGSKAVLRAETAERICFWLIPQALTSAASAFGASAVRAFVSRVMRDIAAGAPTCTTISMM